MLMLLMKYTHRQQRSAAQGREFCHYQAGYQDLLLEHQDQNSGSQDQD